MENNQLQNQISLIREVFAYTGKFKNSTFVIKIDSSLMDQENFPLLAGDICLLKRNGIRIVLVPGSRERIEDIIERYGVECDWWGNLRITTEEAIPFIKMAAFDAANKVMTALSAYGEQAVIGNWVKARSLGVHDGIDLLYTGLVEKVDAKMVNRLLDEGLIPIIPAIGWNSTGLPYNIGSDELASKAASSLNASKLFFLSGEDLLFRDEKKEKIWKMDINTATTYKDNHGGVAENMLLIPAIEACSKGVDRVHILNGMKEGVILKEIFSSIGVGTMIHRNIYESIRPMKQEDIPAVLSLMAPLIAKGLLVERRHEDLLTQIAHFYLFSVDGMIHGCASLTPFPPKSGEIGGVAVDPNYGHLGVGKKLISYLLEKGQQMHMKEIFVLTTEAADWFLSHGFNLARKEDLPEEKRKCYNEKRNSRILIRRMDG